jgi:hypothetical protein
VPGTNRRCYLSPGCICEWSVCSCDDTNTWNCNY